MNTIVYFFINYVGIGALIYLFLIASIFAAADSKSARIEAIKGLLLMFPIWPIIPIYVIIYNLRRRNER